MMEDGVEGNPNDMLSADVDSAVHEAILNSQW